MATTPTNMSIEEQERKVEAIVSATHNAYVFFLNKNACNCHIQTTISNGGLRIETLITAVNGYSIAILIEDLNIRQTQFFTLGPEKISYELMPEGINEFGLDLMFKQIWGKETPPPVVLNTVATKSTVVH